MSKYEFKPNIGRLQKVMSSQEYGKKENKKIKDYVNPSKNRCGRESNIFEDKDTLKSQKDCPNIQHHIPNLMKGPKKKQFKKDEMFEYYCKLLDIDPDWVGDQIRQTTNLNITRSQNKQISETK